MAPDYPQGSLFFLLVIVISECRVEADSPETVFVSAYKEEDALLPCFSSNVTDPKSCYRVRLVKYDTAGGRSDVFAWPRRNQDASRVKWKHDGDGQISLYLTEVVKSDEGLYGCEACQGWECVLVRNISLRVKDCKASPPVKAALGKAIVLKCSVVLGALNVSWAMLKGGKPAPVDVSSSRVTTTGASLIISSVAAADGGWYRCHVAGQTQLCYDVHLLVQAYETETSKASTVPFLPTPEHALVSNGTEQSGAASTRAVASVVSGLVFSAALTGLVLYFRRYSLRSAEQTQRRPAGAVDSVDSYENTSLPEDLSTFSEQSEDENMYRTFQE